MEVVRVQMPNRRGRRKCKSKKGDLKGLVYGKRSRSSKSRSSTCWIIAVFESRVLQIPSSNILRCCRTYKKR